MKRVRPVLVLLPLLCAALVVAHFALIEVGREVVVLYEWREGGELHHSRLWIVDEGRTAWLHHGYADSPWIVRLQTDPVVTVERGGSVRRYHATADPESHRKVHELMRAKYGIADRWVRVLAGDERTCRAVPVRLHLIEGPS